MSHVIVIGGGAAGMMAAVAAARAGHAVDLYEKNEKLGKKIYITGKGRCNLTNACDPQDFPEHVCSNRKFLYSSFYGMTNLQTMEWFEQAGLRIKTERGERVFPVSDHASDVTAVLEKQMRTAGVRVHLQRPVRVLLTQPAVSDEEEPAEDSAPRRASWTKRIAGVTLQDGEEVPADAVIICTGGLSYPSTGSTGDGYRMAEKAGHTVTQLTPSLVPMETQEDDIRRLQGLSLKNVDLTITDGKKKLYADRGEMMFTHFGVTGPLVLTASTCVQKALSKHALTLHINLKPALSAQQLDARFLREFESAQNRQLKNVLGSLYPAKLIPVLIDRSGIPEDKPIHDISREERRRLVELTQDFTATVTGLRGFSEAVITRGGVSVKEVYPDTMESKLVRGLFFAGEVLDVDAVTGGFNLQIAWSTGFAAGNGIS